MAETRGLREALICATGRVPVQRATLYGRVFGEWGSVCERRMDRQLSWCVMVGAIRKIQDGDVPTYVRGVEVDVEEMSVATWLGPRPRGKDHWTKQTGRQPFVRRAA